MMTNALNINVDTSSLGSFISVHENVLFFTVKLAAALGKDKICCQSVVAREKCYMHLKRLLFLQ